MSIQFNPFHSCSLGAMQIPGFGLWSFSSGRWGLACPYSLRKAPSMKINLLPCGWTGPITPVIKSSVRGVRVAVLLPTVYCSFSTTTEEDNTFMTWTVTYKWVERRYQVYNSMFYKKERAKRWCLPTTPEQKKALPPTPHLAQVELHCESEVLCRVNMKFLRCDGVWSLSDRDVRRRLISHLYHHYWHVKTCTFAVVNIHM